MSNHLAELPKQIDRLFNVDRNIMPENGEENSEDGDMDSGTEMPKGFIDFFEQDRTVSSITNVGDLVPILPDLVALPDISLTLSGSPNEDPEIAATPSTYVTAIVDHAVAAEPSAVVTFSSSQDKNKVLEIMPSSSSPVSEIENTVYEHPMPSSSSPVSDRENTVYERPGLLPADWDITKELTTTDADPSSSRLLLPKESAKHLLPHLQQFEHNTGIDIDVYDIDTSTNHILTLKMWKTKSFVLVKNWKKDFLTRRELKVKDEIGLRWDAQNLRFQFTVLNRKSN